MSNINYILTWLSRVCHEVSSPSQQLLLVSLGSSAAAIPGQRGWIVCAPLLPAASTGPQAFSVSNQIPILAAGNNESQSRSTYTTRKWTISGSFMNHNVGTSENTYKKHMLSMDGNRTVQIGRLEQCSCTIASCVKSEHMWATANRRVKPLLAPLQNSCQQLWVNTT